MGEGRLKVLKIEFPGWVSNLRVETLTEMRDAHSIQISCLCNPILRLSRSSALFFDSNSILQFDPRSSAKKGSANKVELKGTLSQFGPNGKSSSPVELIYARVFVELRTFGLDL